MGFLGISGVFLVLTVSSVLGVSRSSDGAPSTLMLQKLDSALTSLERAQTLPVHLEPCDSGLAAAVAAVNEAELFLSSDELLREARLSVEAARNTSSLCLELLRESRNDQSSRSPKMALYKLTLQADKELAQVEAHLPKSNRSHSSPTAAFHHALMDHLRKHPRPNNHLEFTLPQPTCETALLDGTTCQFSACARGRGLLSCSTGFARGVIGGYYGVDYLVTSNEDFPDNPPPGTLRYGVNLAKAHSGGVWITFAESMVIELKGMLWVHSHTTIDGRGHNVTLQRHCLVVCDARHVILENFAINTVRGSDTVHIFLNSAKVWVDHVTSFGGDLGLVSVVQGSTDVTISNCKLQNYNFNMLLGASDFDETDKNLRVSVFRNHFLDSMQRMPHCRWGWCHVANNLYTNWGYYAVGARVHARVKTEKNVFVPSRVSEVTPWHPAAISGVFDMTARIESEDDLLLNGATFHQFLLAQHDVRPPYLWGDYPPLVQPHTLPDLVEACAGQQTVDTIAKCTALAGTVD